VRTSHHSDADGIQKSKTPIQEPVWVQCNGYRCLAVLDEKGCWRSYHNMKPLTDMLHVLGFGAGKDHLATPSGH
jgi:hypothetical protein